MNRNMMMKPAMRAIAALLLVPFLGHTAFAQLSVSPQTDLQQLAQTITGPGVTISNPQVTCHADGFGEFTYAGSLLGIDQGVLLTSGTIANAIGPNDVANKTFQQQAAGDPLLDMVTGRTTKDACKFEFDIIPAGDSLRFDFVFGSEEYNEWVGSQYNDVFGFFISGPGITGDPGAGNQHNIALIPGTGQAVTINNVNNGSNQAYYFDNAGGPYVQYDGFTTGLTAMSAVQPCETYHLKLVVADASDRKYDSGVFIAKVKSNPVTMQLITQIGADSLIEGCNNGKVRFTRQTVTNQPMTLHYFLQGTAVNGTDYAAIAPTNPGSAKTIIIPANQAYVDRPITTLIDATPEALETLLFILGNPNCPNSFTDTLVVPLVDSLTATVQPAVSMICLGGQAPLLATGGSDYTWSPASGLSASNIPNPVASPASTRTYTVHVQDGACSRTLQALVKVSSMVLTAAVTPPLCNGGSNGAINLSVTGGIPPYSCQWSGPGGFSAATEDITGLAAGTYTVTVVDAVCTKTQSFNVAGPALLGVTLAPSLLIFGQNISCSGGHDGSIDATITGGTGPYSAVWSGPGGYSSNAVDISGLGAGTYSVTITDAGGCTATATSTLVESAPMVGTITSTTPVTCANDGSGSATVSINGGMPAYSYAWNTVPVQSSATASGLAPGTYTVTATDQYGCSTSASATIGGPVQPLQVQLAAITNVACSGSGSGSATVAISGGTSPYSISWNTSPVQNATTASGLSGGSYTATATDANGCAASLTVSIMEPALPLSLQVTTQQNIDCTGQTGSATVQASGGTGPYAYAWNTSPGQNNASATGLPGGSHTATATDAQGCQATISVTITAPAAALSASIAASNNVLCAGGTDGGATVQISGGTPPYTQVWNTTPPQSGTSASNLAAGTWQVAVLDANSCATSATVAISQPTALQVSGTVAPAQCQGAANGAVDVTTSFGTPPYTWSWTGPNGYAASTEDINGLSAGGYTLVATDAHGCTATHNFDVNQPGLFTATLTAALHGVANVSCIGSNDGSIDLEVSGAVPPYTYAWSGPNGFTSAMQDIAGLQAGTYSVTITDDNGCSTSLGSVLTAPPALDIQLTSGNFGGTAIACNGGDNGSITTMISGGNPSYSNAWTGPNGFSSTQANLTGLIAGQYQITTTDDNGCSATQSITLTQPAPLVAANGGTTPATCFGSATGQATVSVSGGTEPYSYSWNTSPVQHAATATGLAAGSYIVSITDAHGCSTSGTFNVGGPAAALAINLGSTTNVACHGGQTGAAAVQGTGGTAPYSYSWNTAPATPGPSVSGLAAGTWTVTVTDAAGCTASRSVVITEPGQAITAIVGSQQPVTCYGNANGSASIIVSGGSGNYNITWNTSPAQTGATANGLTPGNYTATITDANGCPQSTELPVAIGGPVIPLAISYAASTYAGGANVSCPGANDGSIDLTVSGGTGPYAYTWLSGNGTSSPVQDPTGLSAGSYHLTIGDAHGCTMDSMVTLSGPAAISATAVVQSAICHGASTGAINLTPAGGAPPYAYQWSGPGGFTASAQDLNLIPAGVYTVVISDANGCSLSQPFDVSEPGTFAFNATITNANCSNSADGAVQLSASGGTAPYQFSWTGPNGFTAGVANISDLQGGTYHLVLTDANGCSALSSYDLTAPTPLTVFAISNKNHNGNDVTCAGASDGSISTTYNGGTPPYTFAWIGPNGFTATTADLSGLASGTYSLTVTDAHGCSISTSATLIAPTPLLANAVAATYAGGGNTSCAGATDGSLVLTPSGGSPPYNVSWTGPGGFASSAWQITGLAAGTYTATVTDLNGCSTTLTRNLTAPAPLTLSASATNTTCFGGLNGSVDLTTAGGSGTCTYQWQGPNAFAASTQDLTALYAGTYSVSVTDANGCTASTTVSITEPSAVQATASISTAACQGANNGAIDLTVTGGTGAYSFLWTGFPAYSATTEDINGLFAGVYTVAITDANGCSLTAPFNVNEPGLFNITAQLSSVGGGYNVSCAGASDGTIDATVAGGTGSYTYYWTGPNGFTSINLDLSGLAAGEYHLTVHDANGCSGSSSFTLVAPAPVSIGLTATAQPACDGGQNGAIDASIMGGTAPYAASWTGPNGFTAIGQNLGGLGAGSYNITVTDALGCGATGNIVLTSPAGISATATPEVMGNGANLSCASSADGSIGLGISGGTPPYSVAWTGPNGFQASSEDISNLAQGLYTAIITDANGCTFAAQAELVAPSPIGTTITTSVYSGGNAVSCAGSADGSISLAISGGSPGYLVAWNGPGGFTSNQTSLANLAPGAYSAVVTDLLGCSASASITLTAPLPITSAVVLSNHNGYEVGCAGNDGTIDLSVAGGLAPYQYSWSGPNGFASSSEDLSSLSAGTYAVTISDANGCNAVRSFTLTAPDALAASLAVTSNECDLSNNGSIDLSVIGGTAPFTFAWSGPDGFTSTDEDMTGLASGTYAVTVTSSLGCITTANATVVAASPMNLSLYVSNYGAVNIPCHGDSSGTIALTVNGGFAPLNIAWTGPGGFLADSTQLSGLRAGTYSVVITDDHGCMRDTSITLIEPDNALATSITQVNIPCHGAATGAIDATVTGGGAPYVFSWRGPDSTMYSSEDLANLGAGTYELVVTDANQCVNTMQVTLTEPDSALTASFSVAAYNGYGTSCADTANGAIQFTAHGGTPGYTYGWTGPDGFVSAEDSISGLSAGNYSITVTDANGCPFNQSITIVPPPAITVQFNAATFPGGSNISCSGMADGSITALVSGGVPNYNLQWSGPGGFTAMGAMIDSLAAGTFCLSVTDANGCTAQPCITMAEPAPLATMLTATTANCGQATGSVDADITGGSAPYTTAWSNGTAAEDLTNVAPGNYVATVTDANGCTVVEAATVGGTPGVTAQASITNPLCHSSTDGAIDLMVLTGTAPFSFQWGNGSTGEDLMSIAGGDEQVTITDANGCAWDSLITITAPGAITADTAISHFANGNNISSWGGQDGSIQLNISGGTPPYAYAWADGAADPGRYGLPAGTYSVTITDANGCSLALTIILTQPDELAMPSGFTPNGDGNNDAFVVHGIDAFPDNQLTVFNRWGNVVYDQLHYSNDWRGENQQGRQLPDGTYFIILRLDATQTLQHYVDLRR
ncbi:MAG: choice-of-anchor L domain-containing protein [Bacteroidetes bacterium]|nr:choice-of-anchor L domain-containing protein [Bacteroidota bacterium]